MTVYEYAVTGVRPVSVYDVVGDVPTTVPSRRMLYPVTYPSDAFQLNATDVPLTVALRFSGAVAGSLGARGS